jgi:mono/diheme cytochrome c family protein
MSRIPFQLLIALLFATAADAAVGFNQHIRPILAEHCFHCHGPDPGSRKAGLRLDMEVGFFTEKDGSTPVVKGKPEQSALYERLISTDPDEIMPPPETHKKLKPEEIALVKQWITEGASWQPHWSFIPPTRPALPKVADGQWGKNGIDAFVLSKLEAANLKPSAEASKHALARRAALDITGLPPSAEALAAFVKDESPQAYERYLDALLKSPAYGEHRARYWLDAARYGDTHGMHFDNYREMWPYRDWVVNAFNVNQPFDQFTMEQVAGDLLPQPTDSQLIATGFQRCNITTNEGGTIDEENLANYASDRVQTLGWVYMGLTTNCAQCHDHKFDPITQKDYYALAAFFRNTTQPAKDGNVKDGRSSTLAVPSAADTPRWNALKKELPAAIHARESQKGKTRPKFDQWLTKAKASDIGTEIVKQSMDYHRMLAEPEQVKITGPATWSAGAPYGSAPVLAAGSSLDLGQAGNYKKEQPTTVAFWVKISRPQVNAVLLGKGSMKERKFKGWQLIQTADKDNKDVAKISMEWGDNALQGSSVLKVVTRPSVLRKDTWHHVAMVYDGGTDTTSVQIYVDGKAQELKPLTNSTKPQADTRSPAPLLLGQIQGGDVNQGLSAQDLRLYSRALSSLEVSALAALPSLRKSLELPAAQRKAEQNNALFDHYLLSQDAKYQELHATVVKLEAEHSIIRGRSAITHIQEERKDMKAMANVLMRGQYDKVGEEVEAAPPAALPALPKDAPRNRLGLARWLVSPQNPLTTRVTVNRLWQELFGSGLVKTAEDFGIMGAAPSHPELLDWLSVEFRESGWDMKRLFKLMLMSSTYRQAATVSAEKLEKDRDNTLLSRGPRFRMDAEMVRDLALAASGTLSAKLGGPSTRPYQPEGIWDVVGLGGGDTRDYVQDKGENLYRRTLYNFWKRMSPPPNLETFNAPSREVSCVRRERTNTPLQALVTLNDVQFVEAARNLAQRALKQADPIAHIAQQLLSRPLTEKESALAQSSHAELLEHYKATPQDAADFLKSSGESPLDPSLPLPELAAMTLVASQVMNLDEALNK